MKNIKMSDVFDLPPKSVEYQNQIVDKNNTGLLFADFHNYEKDALIAAINAYDENQERIRHLISCGNELEHVIDMQRERIDLLEGEFKRICDANALLENQLENAIAEISELKKKARGY